MTQLLFLFRRATAIALVLGALGLVVTVVSIWKSYALQADHQADGKRRFHERIRDGVGREVQFASPGDPPGIVRAAVNSVDNFIFKRSGIKFSGATKDRLAEMEQRALNGETKRLTISELNHILTATAFERLGTLTDEEILHIDDTLRGFNSPDLPSKLRRRDILLPGRVVAIPKDRFVDQLKAVREQTRTDLGDVLRGDTHRAIEDTVQKRVSALSEAVPEKFGGVWNVAGNRDGGSGVTPLQALLIAYSAATTDLLCDSEANLNKYMMDMQKGRTRHLGENFPSPEGHHAFGVNGYLVSSPLDVIFDERTVNRMLDHIEGRSAS
ncbi:MAG TPA: hypothetical protein VJU84_13005 [Pyrinomonadaceae bacterium]|nr:hypothetical protein [Pyrinomonadaceae bacterium]